VQLLRTSREPDNGHGLRLQQSAFSIAQKANALSEMGTGIKIGLQKKFNPKLCQD
jgi:hypothetical protein